MLSSEEQPAVIQNRSRYYHVLQSVRKALTSPQRLRTDGLIYNTTSASPIAIALHFQLSVFKQLNLIGI